MADEQDEGDTRDVASHQLKRAVRGALSLTAVIAVVSFSPLPALAQPPPSNPPAPTTASEALKQYRELNGQATKLNEDLLAAQNDLANKQAELDKATADLSAAQQLKEQARLEEEKFRGQVDNLTSASFQGARFNKLSALLTGSSAEDFLDRASALHVLAADNREALEKFTSAVNQAAEAERAATDAQQRAQDAKVAAEQLTNQITQNKSDLQGRIDEVKKIYDRLSGQDKADLQGPQDSGVYLAPPGVAQAVVQAALNKVGCPYVWGAEGPCAFDCSGLTLFAYRAAGISLPHSSRAQFGFGRPVSGDFQPGDLLFYGGSAGSIHHVGMHIGGGKMIHASTYGVPVKVVDAPRGGGSDYLGARRLLG